MFNQDISLKIFDFMLLATIFHEKNQTEWYNNTILMNYA